MKLIVRLAVLITFYMSAIGLGATTLREKIEKLRQQGKKEGWTFEVAENEVLLKSIQSITGLIKPKNWKELAPFMSMQVRAGLPEKWDWREHDGVTPVKNQGNCGSCWAFGTVAVMEASLKRQTGKDVNISEQQLVSCSPDYGSCSGGYFALGFYKSKGANRTVDFPYKASNVACKNSAPQYEKVQQWAYVGQNNRTATTEELKAAIYDHGPIAVTVSASGSFGAYKSGVYNACNNGRTNHIVTLVGWDDKDQAWIMKNSWGKSWGDQGYMRIRYTGKSGSKCNRIAEDAIVLLSDLK